MTTIASVAARQLLDSKARPMVEVELRTADGAIGRASAPTGSSVGAHEAVILRDGPGAGYRGQSVSVAVQNVLGPIADRILGAEFDSQAAFDSALLSLDGSVDKRLLGGNALYPTSVAFLRAQAAELGVPVYEHIARGPITSLPVPTFNVINGGRNGGVTQAFNEFIIVPYGFDSVDEAIEAGVMVFQELPALIRSATGAAPALANSFGFAAPFSDPRAVLSLIGDAIDAAGYSGRMVFALDCASSEMFDRVDGTYELDGRRVDSLELIAYLRELSEEFDLLFVEDPLDEDDWGGFSAAVRELPRTWVLGDDLIVTNKSRLDRAIAERAADGFVLKPNQIGTITESLATFDAAMAEGMLALPSGRSGGVIDDIVMDLSLGLQVPFQKNGAPRSGERIEKLNFLTRAAERHPDAILGRLEAIARF